MEMDGRRRLRVDQQVISPRLREIGNVALRFNNHQMYVEGLCGRAAHRFDDRRTKGYVGYEPAVHDIDVDPIGAGPIDRLDFLTDPPKVGGENRRRDHNGPHDALGNVELTPGRMKRSIALAKPSSS